MPRIMLGEEMRRAERERKENEDFLKRLGGYLQVTGKSLTDLAVIIGVSPATLYNRVKEPGTFRLSEYRRICEELETVRS